MYLKITQDVDGLTCNDPWKNTNQPNELWVNIVFKCIPAA